MTTPTPWYCFGLSESEVLVKHPNLTSGMGVSPKVGGTKEQPELFQGDKSLLALYSRAGGGGSHLVNWERSSGVHTLTYGGNRSEVHLVAAVEPDFLLVVETYQEGRLKSTQAWDAGGACSVPPVQEKKGFGTFADLFKGRQAIFAASQ